MIGGYRLSHFMESIRRIQASTAAIRHRHEAFESELKALLEFLDHADVLIAYAAKEELQKVLSDYKIMKTRCVGDVVKNIASTSTTVWRQEASAFRFQLLRQLLDVRTGDQSTEKGADKNKHRCTVAHAVLENLLRSMDMVRSVFVSSEHVQSDNSVAAVAAPTTVPSSVQYEALVFLTDFIKCLYVLKTSERLRVELSKQMMLHVDEIFVRLDYYSQATFVSCAVLKVLGDFLQLLKFWKGQIPDDNSTCLETVYSKLLEKCVEWLLQSSCTPMALQLLKASTFAIVTDQDVFVANFSPYPFLQQWLLFLSRLGAAYLAAGATQNKRYTKAISHLPVWNGEFTKQLLSRQQLFTILAEQDDVMIEVLNGLIQMATLAHYLNDPSCPFAHWNPSFTADVAAELNPNLLFADLVVTLEQDHLVLLDFLVSNETQMLEYLMRYLRYLSTNWKTSKQTLNEYKRLEDVMSVLIRLRLEIDRLVAADLFPYTVEPLTERLVTIEQLYEEEGENA